MKKISIYLLFLILAGTLSYFGGYYLYTSNHPKSEYIEPLALQRGIQMNDVTAGEDVQEYYFAKIEQEMLMIYEMPNRLLYDSVELSGIHIQGTDWQQLIEGIRFDSLTEVFEFLENVMS